MTFKQTALVVVLAAVTAFGVSQYAGRGSTSPVSGVKKETAFERVMRTGTLRCGYYVFAPTTLRDPNTGALSGLSVDMMDEIGKNSGLKIEWTEETDFGNWHTGLAAGRFDAMCTPMWPDSHLARIVLFTRPMLFASINAYARFDDHRFDGNLAAINNPSVTIISYENNPAERIAKHFFPKAKIMTLPANSPGGLGAENVKLNKADIVLWDANGVFEFSKNNPQTIRNVDPSHPLKVMPFELLTRIDDPQLRDFLDVSLQELENSGVTNQLIDKWEQTPGSFFRVSQPYINEMK
ncbi:MAG: transporter substrate-binding domain-containing protein [Alphaproteobacteria bacterium]|nr:transporter substrate-binding domain-containing protein [Alphaproteobacteria bacterium]